MRNDDFNNRDQQGTGLVVVKSLLILYFLTAKYFLLICVYIQWFYGLLFWWWLTQGKNPLTWSSTEYNCPLAFTCERRWRLPHSQWLRGRAFVFTFLSSEESWVPIYCWVNGESIWKPLPTRCLLNSWPSVPVGSILTTQVYNITWLPSALFRW